MSNDSLVDLILKHRDELLDRSTRSRLLNTPIGSRARTLEIFGENPDLVYDALVKEGKSMSFLPQLEPRDSDAKNSQEKSDLFILEQPINGIDDEETIKKKTYNKLQTKLGTVKLQNRLLQLFFDARNFEEEQGVNILYLAIGFLKWSDTENSDRDYYAPLLLVPINLERKSATSRFCVSYSGEELSTNLSLQARLKESFGLLLLNIPDNPEDLIPSEYFQQVSDMIKGYPKWEVLNEPMIIGFFSFAKYLMFRDLAPETWHDGMKLESNFLLSALLRDGFKESQDFISDEIFLDDVLNPSDLFHVIDADSSQAVAIEEVSKGQNLVIQGPPGTGKSQTISNIIAAAVLQNKKVLFLAEKMAALEVVKRRLDNIGLGVLCLELHSHKARKKNVLEELKRTFELGRPKIANSLQVVSSLCEKRDELNAHCRRMNTPLGQLGFTIYQIIGQLVQLKAKRIPPQDYKIQSVNKWNRSNLKKREELLESLAKLVAEIGQPNLHPWRGCGLEAVLPQDVDRITTKILNLAKNLSVLKTSIDDLAAMLLVSSCTFEETDELLRFAHVLLDAPPMDAINLNNSVWKNRRTDIPLLLEAGRCFSEKKSRLDGILIQETWENNLNNVRMILKAYENSTFRYFFRDYRNARSTLKGYCVERSRYRISEQVILLDELAEGQMALSRVRIWDELGRDAFGNYWNGDTSDWQTLSVIEKWEHKAIEAGLCGDIHKVAVSALANKARIRELVVQIESNKNYAFSEIDKLFKILIMDIKTAFSANTILTIPFNDLLERFSDWTSASELLYQWIDYMVHYKDAIKMNLEVIVERMHDGRILPEVLMDSFRYAVFEELMRKAIELHPELNRFRGIDHEAKINEFRKLDKDRIYLARHEVLVKHYDGIPRGGGVGEVGILKREMNKQRNHLPIRQLMKQTGRTIQLLKPIFMMSPMSVAQYLEPGLLEFDLLLIDEASQIRPVDSLGAIARTKQIVVVGDDKQLPPTSFFERLLEDEEEIADTENFALKDMDSILGLCHAQGMPDKMLRWHYRSRHESLIAVSNRNFYDNRLYIVPSASNNNDFGLRYHKINGVYYRGRSATNPAEALAVAKAVIDFSRRHPELSLGVGTFSVRQRDAIRDELELLRRDTPDVEEFFNLQNKAEPFFIKNLESIQGDERDVVFISLGYAKDEDGYMSMNFGPLSTEGGQRRLNVLITRARQRCEVFASIGADDIDLNRAKSPGVRILKEFLSYAQNGHFDIPRTTGRDPDSVFEEEVARALTQAGWEVEHQVGVAGFFIDLAIRDKENQGAYLLGIECDGAAYHSSRWARDRDRLRQEVLESRGWIIHRVWSRDWFNSPTNELTKILSSIKIAMHHASSPTSNTIEVPINRELFGEEISNDNISQLTNPYKEANVNWSDAIRSMQAQYNSPLEVIVQLIFQIVSIEEPIHQDEIIRRFAEAIGKDRSGSKIQRIVINALKSGMCREMILKSEENFYCTKPIHSIVPRDRSNVKSSLLKKIEMIPPIEITTGIKMVLRANPGSTSNEVAVQVARMLGFNRTGENIKKYIEVHIDKLLNSVQIVAEGEKLYCINNDHASNTTSKDVFN